MRLLVGDELAGFIQCEAVAFAASLCRFDAI